MYFFLESPFDDVEQKPSAYNDLAFGTICSVRTNIYIQ